jgi:hypothetical protein
VLVDGIIPTARAEMFLTLEAVVVLSVGALIFPRHAPRAAEAL